MGRKYVKSLRSQLLTITLINVVVIALIVGIIASVSSSKLVREKSEQSLQNKTIRIADELNGAMSMIETSVCILADTVEEAAKWTL